MAPSVSKLSSLPFNCYELGHTWNPSCARAAADVGFYCFKESFKIYSSCYVLSLLASKRYPKSRAEALKMVKDVLRSSSFLSVNGFGFVAFFCFIRKLLGRFNFFTIGYIPAFFGSYLAILVEKPHRRALLALYTTNVASETIFRMLRARKIINNIEHFDTLMFIISASTILYQMKKGNGKGDIIDTIVKKIVGTEEFTVAESGEEQTELDAERNEAIIGHREVNNVGPGLIIGGPEGDLNGQYRLLNGRRKRDESYRARFIRFVFWMHRQTEDIASHLERMVVAVHEGQSHDTCPHKKPCFHYWSEGFLTRFAAGFGIQAVIQIIMFLRGLVTARRRPRLPEPRSSSLYKCLKTGAGLSSVSLTFRLLCCSFRWLLGNEHPIHGVAAGVVASAFGCALLNPPPTLALYLFFKAAEALISDSHRQNNWKIITWLDSFYGGGWCLLFAASTAVLFHAGMLEPQNLKPSYYNFLQKVTGRKLQDINRHLMTVYGTNSNLLMKKEWPVFDHRFISDNMKKLLKEREASGRGNELIKEITMQFVPGYAKKS